MSAQTKAGSEPAFPVIGAVGAPADYPGLTKRDLACIELRIPATGDAELDALIARAQRRDLAAMVMNGFAADPHVDAAGSAVADLAANWADALLAELEKAHG